ncbi:L,D-transpeptidase [Hyphomicrobium sp.]|jgi:lipoprotein-anchoring transpeptidase ErfK/SrfK|uniref:L,D-transpeptidase n=1 Tax=Hyphomicrobium sp. TaxID=82 RepID=UPI002C2B905B|nr:L,D-transpeptidase [Hyphomicrobium sp.]HVZ03139.1 L,D-transpeptidase [Hyphomicrobium sp.]
MKTFIAAAAALGASVACSTWASAQEWNPWDRAGSAPPAQGYFDGYGGRYNDDDRYGARVYRRFDNDDDRRYDPRYNDDPSYDGRRYTRDDDRYGRDWRRDDYGAWDAAPSPGEEEQLRKTTGVNSGNRPYIKPVAPPVVNFSGPYAEGSVVIDTSRRKLYYVLSPTKAYAYPIAVGRQGFSWTGKEKISRIADWPDWYPPADMRKRQPKLPKRVLGGIRNPLGAKAIYLGNTLYRIHGTNEPKSIGKAESSGCFRMLNENVLHLASLVHVGTEVTVVRSLDGKIASATTTAKSRRSVNRSSTQQYRRGDDYDDPYEYDPWR